MDTLESLEKRLGVSFRRRDLLRLALVHRSYLNENVDALPESNERLEFLGDALIGLVVASELYLRYSHRHEGELTAMRSALVQGETLAHVAEGLDLGQCLSMGKGEEAGGGRDRPSNLAATFEALVGALFIDQGYQIASEFVIRILAQDLSTVGQGDVLKAPKSLLQELVQGRGMAIPTYRIVEEIGKDHARQFTAEVEVSGEVLGVGIGPRKSLAEREAAREALKVFGYDH